MDFVCDAMLGKTARFLRLLGFDTLYSNSYTDPELIEIARNENRILLTRDAELYNRAKKLDIMSFLMKEKNYINRLTKILSILIEEGKISLDLDPFNSRCATCNAQIMQIPKEDVEGKVPKGTYLSYDEFWVCTNPKCGKIYYQGPHWTNIIKIYEQVLNNLKNMKKDEL